jgi:hypothetical protein
LSSQSSSSKSSVSTIIFTTAGAGLDSSDLELFGTLPLGLGLFIDEHCVA